MRQARSKLLAIILAVMVMMTYAVPAFAEDGAAELAAETVAETEDTEKPAPEEPKETVESTASTENTESAEESPEGSEQKEEEPTGQSVGEQGASDQTKPGKEVSEKKGSPADLADGTYKPDNFEFNGGTGKAKMTCDKVVIKGGKATAIMKASSENMTHIYMGEAPSNDETPALYDPATNKMGEDVYPITKQQVSVPVEVNTEQAQPCAVRTTAMTVPHWVNYTYKLVLTEKAEKISDSTDIPENGESQGGGEQTDPADPADPSKPGGQDTPSDPGKQDDQTTPTGKQKITAGTWKVKATTDRKMFYLYPKSTDPAQVILKVASNGSMTATITLSAEGYDYVYMGTPAQAKRAGKSKWIKASIVNGYYTFTIPVSALDKKLTITPHSKKYENDGDPSTDPWRKDKWIIFYSSGAVKVQDGTAVITGKKKTTKKTGSKKTSGTQTKFKNNNKADKVSKWKDDSGKSTGAVNNSTSLKDGVYTPDSFTWKGGSGRLAYITCNKITVKGGKAYATIEFSSSKYDSLKANGRVYSKQGGGNSRFVIPVKLNANNTIIGRTTAMSQPHWIKYTIFIYKAGADAGAKNAAAGTDGHVTNTKALTDKAPDLLGLKQTGTEKIKYAKYFKIFRYEQGITLISIDQGTNTGLKTSAKAGSDAKAGQPEKEETIADKALKADEPTVAEEADAAGAGAEETAQAVEQEEQEKAAENQPKVEYDEEGKPIAKSENELTNELYQNTVVNYLIVPEKVEIPAGLEKDCVIIKKPVKHSYIASKEAAEVIEGLEKTDAVSLVGSLAKDIKNDKIKEIGDFEKPDFREIVKTKADLAVLPGEALPAKVTKKSSQEEKDASEKTLKQLQRLQTRFSSLEVPLLIDRAGDEDSNYAKAEWAKVYGEIFGETKAADQLLNQYIRKNKEEKIINE